MRLLIFCGLILGATVLVRATSKDDCDDGNRTLSHSVDDDEYYYSNKKGIKVVIRAKPKNGSNVYVWPKRKNDSESTHDDERGINVVIIWPQTATETTTKATTPPVTPPTQPTKPPPPKCGANEQLFECPFTCPEDSCQNYFTGMRIRCRRPDPNECRPACRCRSGYLREGGECIKPAQCCKDPNSELRACPNPCPGGTCAQPEFEPCKRKCNEYGCECRRGFVKWSDAGAERCVRVKDCPYLEKEHPGVGPDNRSIWTKPPVTPPTQPTRPPPPKCSANEQLIECPLICPENDCKNYFEGIRYLCLRPDPTKCRAACKCRSGYVREDGECIEPAQCCKDPNAELVACPNPCPGGTCARPEFEPCKRKCDAYGCQCKRGFVKRSDADVLVKGYWKDADRCVRVKDCPCRDEGRPGAGPEQIQQ